jgi:hypothetical protein
VRARNHPAAAPERVERPLTHDWNSLGKAPEQLGCLDDPIHARPTDIRRRVKVPVARDCAPNAATNGAECAVAQPAYARCAHEHFNVGSGFMQKRRRFDRALSCSNPRRDADRQSESDCGVPTWCDASSFPTASNCGGRRANAPRPHAITNAPRSDDSFVVEQQPRTLVIAI